MPGYRIVALALLMSTWTISALAEDFSQMYERTALEITRKRLEPSLHQFFDLEVLARLTPSEHSRVAHASLAVPTVGVNGSPFDYYADPATGVVTMPLFSVKFFADLATSVAWLERHQCATTAVWDYVGMLRVQFREISSVRRFPTPMEALGVPNNALDDPWVDDVRQKALKSAMFFVMAHEVGHVYYGHLGSMQLTVAEAQRQETDADSFALQVMRRIPVVPVGMIEFFMAFRRFEVRPADFPSMLAYETYLRQHQTHPLTTERLEALADGIRRNAAGFAESQADPALWQTRLYGFAEDLTRIKSLLGDRNLRAREDRLDRVMGFEQLASACGPR